MTTLYWLDPDNEDSPFPPVELALDDPDGLLAIGGSLGSRRLLRAYRHGIFPWYSEGQPILWWSPNPRSVLFPENIRVSRSLRKTLRKHPFSLTMDTAFEQVISACGEPRDYHPGTWITPEMAEAYIQLYASGHAHSVETWDEQGQLVGGLYGISIGKVFFGESMFSRRTDASKVAFVHLVGQLRAWKYGLIDCQVQSQHLDSLGAENIARERFIELLDRYCTSPGRPAPWRLTWEYHSDQTA